MRQVLAGPAATLFENLFTPLSAPLYSHLREPLQAATLFENLCHRVINDIWYPAELSNRPPKPRAAHLLFTAPCRHRPVHTALFTPSCSHRPVHRYPAEQTTRDGRCNLNGPHPKGFTVQGAAMMATALGGLLDPNPSRSEHLH